MKVLKFSALALASVMALGLVGCEPQVDPKVRFMTDCKEKLTPDECRRIADEKAFEEQQRVALRQQQLQQPTQVYSQPAQGYATDVMPPANYGQTGYVAPAPSTAYVQPAPSSGGFVESAAGAVVGGVAGAVIGNALTKDRSNDRQYQNTNNYNKNYQQPNNYNNGSTYQQARTTSTYQQPKQQQYQAPKQTTNAPSASAFARQAPKPAVKQATYTPRPSAPSKPAATSRPSTSAFKR